MSEARRVLPRRNPRRGRLPSEDPIPPPAPLPEPKRKGRGNDKRQAHQQPTKQRRKGEEGDGEDDDVFAAVAEIGKEAVGAGGGQSFAFHLVPTDVFIMFFHYLPVELVGVAGRVNRCFREHSCSPYTVQKLVIKGEESMWGRMSNHQLLQLASRLRACREITIERIPRPWYPQCHQLRPLVETAATALQTLKINSIKEDSPAVRALQQQGADQVDAAITAGLIIAGPAPPHQHQHQQQQQGQQQQGQGQAAAQAGGVNEHKPDEPEFVDVEADEVIPAAVKVRFTALKKVDLTGFEDFSNVTRLWECPEVDDVKVRYHSSLKGFQVEAQKAAPDLAFLRQSGKVKRIELTGHSKQIPNRLLALPHLNGLIELVLSSFLWEANDVRRLSELLVAKRPPIRALHIPYLTMKNCLDVDPLLGFLASNNKCTLKVESFTVGPRRTGWFALRPAHPFPRFLRHIAPNLRRFDITSPSPDPPPQAANPQVAAMNTYDPAADLNAAFAALDRQIDFPALRNVSVTLNENHESPAFLGRSAMPMVRRLRINGMRTALLQEIQTNHQPMPPAPLPPFISKEGDEGGDKKKDKSGSKETQTGGDGGCGEGGGGGEGEGGAPDTQDDEDIALAESWNNDGDLDGLGALISQLKHIHSIEYANLSPRLQCYCMQKMLQVKRQTEREARKKTTPDTTMGDLIRSRNSSTAYTYLSPSMHDSAVDSLEVDVLTEQLAKLLIRQRPPLETIKLQVEAKGTTGGVPVLWPYHCSAATFENMLNFLPKLKKIHIAVSARRRIVPTSYLRELSWALARSGFRMHRANPPQANLNNIQDGHLNFLDFERPQKGQMKLVAGGWRQLLKRSAAEAFGRGMVRQRRSVSHWGSVVTHVGTIEPMDYRKRPPSDIPTALADGYDLVARERSRGGKAGPTPPKNDSPEEGNNTVNNNSSAGAGGGLGQNEGAGQAGSGGGHVNAKHAAPAAARGGVMRRGPRPRGRGGRSRGEQGGAGAGGEGDQPQQQPPPPPPQQRVYRTRQAVANEAAANAATGAGQGAAVGGGGGQGPNNTNRSEPKNKKRRTRN
ncbi:unnamed protein product [Vitrella brassicaformis CCMP3155]|uniref:Uncharacterized protein n=1 Tax=Vitrella brassicaformis (strain CCMP3155) TaxID=1169540 RepID=A0A0G4FHR0_VITBC|nr:unnamed protein product [Vitrella brassicaformis CCMP3155]|eukprot:CEM12605.1 unnamed protein product [Vitrella brassicaformis CCMP3155]